MVLYIASIVLKFNCVNYFYFESVVFPCYFLLDEEVAKELICTERTTDTFYCIDRVDGGDYRLLSYISLKLENHEKDCL